MRNQRKSRLEQWTDQVNEASEFVRALTTLVDALTVFADRSRVMVIAVTFLVLTIVASLTLL